MPKPKKRAESTVPQAPWGKPLSRICVVSLCIIFLTLALFSPVCHFDFINYDDPDYVTNNPQVQSGLTKEGIVWAFGKVHGSATYWHPLTWISHMLDCQLFGLNAGDHHVMSLAFHAANAMLLFLLLRRMTGAFWRSAIVATLFAIHPLQVESVAWITERKNQLSTLFWILTMLAYVGYVDANKTRPAKAKLFYALTLLCFVLGLMSKPMLVTLPCVLLLIDFWPLRRLAKSTRNGEGRTFGFLILEKIPLFALALTSAVITIRAHKELGLVISDRDLSFSDRLINAVISYFQYVAKTFWPSPLSVYYPIPETWNHAQIALGVLLLIGTTVFAIWRARRESYFLVGWLWFLGTLVPVIGILQVGNQAMAERFMYVPIIGLFIAIVWGATSLLNRFRVATPAVACSTAAVLGACAAVTHAQLQYWRNSLTLFEHSADVIPNNVLAVVQVGKAFESSGDVDGALKQYETALKMQPEFPQMYYNIGNLLAQKGQTEAAIEHYHSALKLNPNFGECHYNLGVVLENSGKRDEAIGEYQAAVAASPQDVDAVMALGTALEAHGKHDTAAEFFSRAVALRPDDAHLHYEFSKALSGQGKTGQAIQECETAVRLQPNFGEAQYVLGNFCVMQGRREEAAVHYREASKLLPQNEELRRRLAALEREAH